MSPPAVDVDRGVEVEPMLIPVTDDQREIWLASQLGLEASATYHGVYVIQVEGSVDEVRLGWALQEPVNRHEALRITLTSDGQSQAIAPTRQQTLEIVRVQGTLGREEPVLMRVLDSFLSSQASPA